MRPERFVDSSLLKSEIFSGVLLKEMAIQHPCHGMARKLFSVLNTNAILLRAMPCVNDLKLPFTSLRCCIEFDRSHNTKLLFCDVIKMWNFLCQRQWYCCLFSFKHNWQSGLYHSTLSFHHDKTQEVVGVCHLDVRSLLREFFQCPK